MTDQFAKVRAIIADALYANPEDVTRDASLMRDLGAESIDFLDIIFRLEKEFSIKLPKGDIEKRARGGLSEEEFAINGLLQEKGLARLREVMPEVNQTAIRAGLYLRDIPSLFTAATFERMVAEQLGGSARTNETAPAVRSGATPAHVSVIG